MKTSGLSEEFSTWLRSYTMEVQNNKSAYMGSLKRNKIHVKNNAIPTILHDSIHNHLIYSEKGCRIAAVVNSENTCWFVRPADEWKTSLAVAVAVAVISTSDLRTLRPYAYRLPYLPYPYRRRRPFVDDRPLDRPSCLRLLPSVRRRARVPSWPGGVPYLRRCGELYVENHRSTCLLCCVGFCLSLFLFLLFVCQGCVCTRFRRACFWPTFSVDNGCLF
ncbi:hypothetical protein SODALDRAFT_206116 [Sodiomyces alkalinus F11]|uniref:Uncharacterized protein n=1 Tax=Sodiomyces alkalinus (strain CBS 110278 / VKM F-3762 / F11) TaxID=1314773 RepID=A0A3N2PQI7_SODAK|nr:hypothetical protein SODALDRAFT_206116 [Sodiomyces alkalinus F11]ROT36738.1 hypothetical protein SODALDRAFT_206116 [Sodiomyces alkalinus F11]